MCDGLYDMGFAGTDTNTVQQAIGNRRSVPRVRQLWPVDPTRMREYTSMPRVTDDVAAGSRHLQCHAPQHSNDVLPDDLQELHGLSSLSNQPFNLGATGNGYPSFQEIIQVCPSDVNPEEFDQYLSPPTQASVPHTLTHSAGQTGQPTSQNPPVSTPSAASADPSTSSHSERTSIPSYQKRSYFYDKSQFCGAVAQSNGFSGVMVPSICRSDLVQVLLRIRNTPECTLNVGHKLVSALCSEFNDTRNNVSCFYFDTLPMVLNHYKLSNLLIPNDFLDAKSDFLADKATQQAFGADYILSKENKALITMIFAVALLRPNFSSDDLRNLQYAVARLVNLPTFAVRKWWTAHQSELKAEGIKLKKLRALPNHVQMTEQKLQQLMTLTDQTIKPLSSAQKEALKSFFKKFGPMDETYTEQLGKHWRVNSLEIYDFFQSLKVPKYSLVGKASTSHRSDRSRRPYPPAGKMAR